MVITKKRKMETWTTIIFSLAKTFSDYLALNNLERKNRTDKISTIPGKNLFAVSNLNTINNFTRPQNLYMIA